MNTKSTAQAAPRARSTSTRHTDLPLADVLTGGRAPSHEEAPLVGLLEPLGLIDRAIPEHARRSPCFLHVISTPWSLD